MTCHYRNYGLTLNLRRNYDEPVIVMFRSSLRAHVDVFIQI